MTRIPALTSRDALDPPQQAVYDAILASRGAVGGLWQVLLHRPPIAEAAVSLGGYLRTGSGLAPAVREATILTTVALLECAYEWHSHRAAALAAGLDDAAIERIKAGRYAELDGDIGLAARFTHAALVEHRVSDALFTLARERWSPPELLDLTATIGYWSFLAPILNSFEVRPPQS